MDDMVDALISILIVVVTMAMLAVLLVDTGVAPSWLTYLFYG